MAWRYKNIKSAGMAYQKHARMPAHEKVWDARAEGSYQHIFLNESASPYHPLPRASAHALGRAFCRKGNFRFAPCMALRAALARARAWRAARATRRAIKIIIARMASLS